MKSLQYLLSVTALALVLGCSESPSTTPNDATSSQADKAGSEAISLDDTVTLEEVKEKVSEAAEVTHEYTSQEMQEYVDSMDTKLRELDAHREQMQQKGNELAGDARQRWEDQLSALQDKRQKLQEDLNRLAGSSGEAWQKIKKGIDAAWDDLKKATDAAAKEFI